MTKALKDIFSSLSLVAMALAFVSSFALIGPGDAEARPGRPRVDVWEVAVDSATCVTIDIASHTATDVVATPPAVALSSGSAVEVFNVDDSVSLNCSFNTQVSTQSADDNYGREISPNKGVLWQVNPDKIRVFCSSQGGNATSRATICQFR